jgi:two-component system, NtrC family, response regulator AtoC
MWRVHRLISEIAPTDVPVLLLGESGTGKEVAAMQIHTLSRHKNAPFIKVSCAGGFPDVLRADSDNGNGGAKHAASGTLFLDEVGELDPDSQRRLLHFMVDANDGSASFFGRRIISASARDLESDAHDGRFRSDLFYRLSGVCVQLPPLRSRREEIPELVRHFLRKYARLFGRNEIELSDPVRQVLVDHPWPGNIRQLENVIKRIVLLDNEDLGIVDLRVSPMIAGQVSAVPLPPRSLKAASRAASRSAERELILQTLEKTHWNRKKAAEALQISYKSLLLKLKRIQVSESQES